VFREAQVGESCRIGGCGRASQCLRRCLGLELRWRMTTEDWEEGVVDAIGRFSRLSWCSSLASPPCGEVGQLAQRASRVGVR